MALNGFRNLITINTSPTGMEIVIFELSGKLLHRRPIDLQQDGPSAPWMRLMQRSQQPRPSQYPQKPHLSVPQPQQKPSSSSSSSHSSDPATLPAAKPRFVGAFGDRVYVSDLSRDVVYIFSCEGVCVGAFGGSGSDVGRFQKPTGIAFDATGNVLGRFPFSRPTLGSCPIWLLKITFLSGHFQSNYNPYTDPSSLLNC